MIRVRALLSIVIATIGSNLCIAQQDLINKLMPKPVPASPNAAALGRFGDYQVSHFTGLPSISIPIYEAKSGELNVPITLNYHASGNRPTDVAGWVGLGWSLNTGGQVTRTVNGKRDEDHYFTHPLNTSPSNCNSYYYLQYAAGGVIDTEPDVFSYSYPGGGGKFIFRNTGTYVNENSTAPIGPAYLFPYAPILVNRVNDQKFEITNENGVLFRYGTNAGGTTSVEGTNAFNGGNPTVQATTAWNLMDVVAPNSNDAITFTYQSVGTATRHDVAHSWLVTDLCDAVPGKSCPPATHISAQPALNTDSNVNQQGVSEIFFENGKVQFFLSSVQRSDVNTLKYLDRVEIYELFNGVYTRKKTVQFNYSYFTNAAGGNAALKLNTVQFKDSGGAVVQTYTFTYFTNSFSWNPTNPNYLNARDYWRFYNGALSNTDLVKQQTVLYQATVASTPTNILIGGAIDREVDTLYSKEGVLKRIDFPTGGYTEFDFENHKYLNDQSVVTNSGGLRVKKITSTDSPTGTPVVKTYRYGIGESGVGKALFSSNQWNYSGEQVVAGPLCDGVNGPDVVTRIRSYHGSSFDVEESSPVVYASVTEYFGDPLGVTNGKIVYEYDGGIIPADIDQTVIGSSKVFRNTFAWKRGKLTKKTVYDRLNNKLSEATTSYSMFKEQGVLVGIGAYTYRVGNGTPCGGGGTCFNEYGESVIQDIYRAASYTQSSGVLQPTWVAVSSYENGAVSNVVSSYTSSVLDPDKLQLLQSTVTRSNSNSDQVTVNLYPFQLAASVNASSTGAAKGIYMLNNKNILTAPCESYTYLQGPGGTNQRVISSQLTTYRQNANNTNHVVPDQIFLFESAEPLIKTSFTPMTINGTNSGVNKDTRYKARLTFTNYDANSNILQGSKTNDTPISFQYGYNNFLPVAEIKNAQSSPGLVEFLHQGFEYGTITGVVNNAAAAQSGNRYKNGDYTISFTVPNSRSYVIEYFYYSSSTWNFIRKAYTGPTMALTEGSRIDNIRIRPVDSAMSTYTYNPLDGMTSVTDPNNVTTFYEYDTFGRMQIVKDHNKHALSTYNYHYYNQQ